METAREYRIQFKDLREKQGNYENLKSLFDDHARGELDENYYVYEGLLFHKDQWMRRWQVVIPEEIQRKLVQNVHSKLGHPGVKKTLDYLR